MAIERKCCNCEFFEQSTMEEKLGWCSYKQSDVLKEETFNDWCFSPKEELVRQDERNKILETISKVCTRENAKFCFQLDGKNYQVAQVGTIDSMEQIFKQEERDKIITLLKSDLETLDLTDDNSNISENYAIKDYIESTIKLLEKE